MLDIRCYHHIANQDILQCIGLSTLARHATHRHIAFSHIAWLTDDITRQALRCPLVALPQPSMETVFYGQLHHGSRRPGGQYKRYKDCLKSTLNHCGIAPSELEALAMDRANWRSSCKTAEEKVKTRHIQELESKRDLHKPGPAAPTNNFECQICHRMCRSWIGLLAHNKSHS